MQPAGFELATFCLRNKTALRAKNSFTIVFSVLKYFFIPKIKNSEADMLEKFLISLILLIFINLE